MLRLKMLLLAVLVALLSAVTLMSAGGATASKEAIPLKVAFVYVGSPSDLGWTMAHDQGRIYLEQTLPYVKTAFAENVAEAESERVIRGFAEEGYDIIFTTSFGFGDPTIAVAKDFPNTLFMHCSGYKRAKNVGTYFGRMYEARYLSGIVAGKMTKNNKLGYVAAHPIPEVIRGINAFALGAQSVNPDVKVYVTWTHAWFAPQKERQAAESLVALGVDVLAQHQDSPETQKVAAEHGIYSVGYDSPMGEFNPEGYLTAPIWHWGPLYVRIVKAVEEMKQIEADLGVKIDSDWSNVAIWEGFEVIKEGKEPIIGLDEFGPVVPQDVRELVEQKKQEIIEGTLEVFPGLTDEEMLQMDYFVEGVVGSPTG